VNPFMSMFQALEHIAASSRYYVCAKGGTYLIGCAYRRGAGYNDVSGGSLPYFSMGT
jgi:hypothetical protein